MKAGGAGPHSRLSRMARLYVILMWASVRARMQYKFDFISQSLIQAVMALYDFFLIAVILWKFQSIAGWNIYEVGMLFASSRLGYGLYRMFGNELDRFEPYIIRGDFDSVLIRPYPTLFVLLSRNFDLSRVTWVAEGIGIGALSAPGLLAAGTLTRAGLVHIACSAVWSALLFAAVGLATAACAFWIVRIEELQVFTLNATGTACLYPLEIYPRWLRATLLYVLPIAMGNYVPVVYVLGKGGTALNLVLPPIASAVSLFLAYRFWRLGEARYHSTGS